MERVLELKYGESVDYIKLFQLFFKIDLSSIPQDKYFHFLLIKFFRQFNNVKNFDIALMLCLTCPKIKLMNDIRNNKNDLTNYKHADIVRIHLDFQSLSKMVVILLWLMNIPYTFDLDFMKRISRGYIIPFILMLEKQSVDGFLPTKEKKWKENYDVLDKLVKII